ncbi:MAG: hypothetical protein PHU71_05515 [Candidatus Gracilibacteria bacterium]|nr:hypothetical protein [Candidatus Gracilibacteria bacterium]
MKYINHTYSPQKNLLALELVEPSCDHAKNTEKIRSHIRDELSWILAGPNPYPVPEITCRIKGREGLVFSIRPEEIEKDLSNLDELLDQVNF